MIFLMRHGQSQANAQRIIAGHRDSPLSRLGYQQAKRAGEALHRNLTISLIISSPMTRAVQTAKIVAGRIGYNLDRLEIINELEERHLGELEGKHYDETPYGNGNVEAAEGATGIEEIEQFYARTQHAFNIITAHRARNILVVCHNGTGRMLQVVAHNEPPIAMYKQPRMEHGVLYPLETS